MTAGRAGLCSVAFRHLDVAEVLRVASAAELVCVEWAGDPCVPPGGDAGARARLATSSAGLGVASYGSYLRVGGTTFADDLANTVRTAVDLGAPRIRVGGFRPARERVGSRAAPDDRPAARSRGPCDDSGLTVALECHHGTLTEHAEDARRLVEDTAHPRLGLHWQPPVGLPARAVLRNLDTTAGLVRAVHVFARDAHGARLPLRAQAALWPEAIGRLRAEVAPPADFLLEFVPDDDPARLAAEADTLRELLAGAW
ncbi:sugar phosphate isomerase/epimerase family protein [Saccharopolyspora sp. NPDC002376]